MCQGRALSARPANLNIGHKREISRLGHRSENVPAAQCFRLLLLDPLRQIAGRGLPRHHHSLHHYHLRHHSQLPLHLVR